MAGLYDVTVGADGHLEGASPLGGRIRGSIAEEVSLGIHRIDATITGGGAEARAKAFARPGTDSGAYRWIVLSTGETKGRKVVTGFIDPNSNPATGFIDPNSDP